MNEEKTIILASWVDRLIAYIIDSLVLSAIFLILRHSWILAVFSTQLLSWLYWTVLEGMYGQSLGKKLLSIYVTNLEGKEIDLIKAGIESFGKIFPIVLVDVLIGLIFFDDKRQRLFNKLSDTIVISKVEGSVPVKVKYVKK
ncbi:RDD family protein [Candidatus Geothermarchaeota archaeon]|nr:MAG: RDD family protein [Candidatus Geothermarchaeota archaeon]